MVKFFLSIFLLLFLVACSNEEHGNGEQGDGENAGTYEVTVLSTFDVNKAELLFATSSPLSSSSRTSGALAPSQKNTMQKIKKINANGSVEDVNSTTKKGQSTQDIDLEDMEVKYIENVNDQYILMAYGVQDTIYKTYLIKKSDGSAYDLEQHISSAVLSEPTVRKLTQVDSDNNIYIILVDTDADGIIQLYKFADGSLEKTLVSDPKETKVGAFNIDKYNNIMYTYYRLDTDETHPKYIKNSGDVLSLPISNFISYFNDYDGNMIYFEQDTTILKKINGLDYSISDYADVSGVASYIGSVYYLKDKKTIISENYEQVIELVNSSKVPKIMDQTSSFNIKKVVVGEGPLVGTSNQYLYMAATDLDDKPFLIKIDTDDYSYTYLTHGDYNITKLAVFPNDDITFNAIRLSDSTNVIGKITVTEGLRILEELALDTNVSILEKIN